MFQQETNLQGVGRPGAAPASRFVFGGPLRFARYPYSIVAWRARSRPPWEGRKPVNGGQVGPSALRTPSHTQARQPSMDILRFAPFPRAAGISRSASGGRRFGTGAFLVPRDRFSVARSWLKDPWHARRHGTPPGAVFSGGPVLRELHGPSPDAGIPAGKALAGGSWRLFRPVLVAGASGTCSTHDKKPGRPSGLRS